MPEVLRKFDLGLQTFRRRPSRQRNAGTTRQRPQVEQVLPHAGPPPRSCRIDKQGRQTRKMFGAGLDGIDPAPLASSRSDVASRLLIARMPVSGVRTSCAKAASAASTMPGPDTAARLRRGLAVLGRQLFGALLRRPFFGPLNACAWFCRHVPCPASTSMPCHAAGSHGRVCASHSR